MEDRNPLNASQRARALRRALRRGRERGEGAAFDRSVPFELLLHGIVTPADLSPRVRLAPGRSPYLIRLGSRTREAPADQDAPEIAVNLLVPESFLVRETALETLGDDLSLDARDVLLQLAEDFPSATTPLPSSGGKEIAPVLPLPKGGLEGVAWAVASFDISAFAPPAPPEDIVSRLVLPEAEEDAENADALDLEEILREDLPFARRGAAPARVAFVFHHGWQRALGVFVLLSFAFVLPLHAMNLVSDARHAERSVRDAGLSGLSALTAAGEAAARLDAQEAQRSFAAAEGRFAQAQSSVAALERDLLAAIAVFPSSEARSGKALLAAAEATSAAGKRIAQAFVAMEENPDASPTARLAVLSAYLEAALPDLEAAEASLARVDASLVPSDQRGAFQEAARRLPLLAGTVREFLEFEPMLSTILGAKGTKRYLAVFQNNTELRATGGFMGSFAEVHLAQGELVRLHVPGGGTYDLQGSLRRFLKAPEPLRLLNARWEFQDANWFPDFPTSARKILEFYADAGQGSVDGVFAVNATYVEDLLALLGPVDMPDYGRTITAENFLFETQKIVEIEYDRTQNRPKEFLGDLAPLLIERALSQKGEAFLLTLDHLIDGLRRKDLQLFFPDNALQREVLALGWGGEMKAAEQDSLMVVDTNLGGGKTDLSIREDIALEVRVAADGSVTNTLTVDRTHFGIPGATFSGVNNVDYLRVYVPKGSTLLHAEGFTIPDASLFERPQDDWQTDPELSYATRTLRRDPASGTDVYEEAGKTVFGNWVQTKPGTTSRATFTYRLPFTVASPKPAGWIQKAKGLLGLSRTASYSLVLQKQPGVVERTTRVSLEVPPSLRTLWSSHETRDAAFTNATDAFFAALFEPAL